VIQVTHSPPLTGEKNHLWNLVLRKEMAMGNPMRSKRMHITALFVLLLTLVPEATGIVEVHDVAAGCVRQMVTAEGYNGPHLRWPFGPGNDWVVLGQGGYYCHGHGGSSGSEGDKFTLDLKRADGTSSLGEEVYAVQNGRMLDYWVLQVKDANGDLTDYYVYYGHTEDYSHKPGDDVKIGERLGRIDNTQDPPHLHFGIAKWTGPGNPVGWFSNPGWVPVYIQNIGSCGQDFPFDGSSCQYAGEVIDLEPCETPEQTDNIVASSATALLIDMSGSMGENWQGGVKIESAKAAAVDVINMIEQESQIGASDHQVAIATFTTDAYIDLGLTTDYNTARQVVNGLMPLDQTNIGDGLQVSNQALTSAPAGAQKIIILLSDGLTNEGLSRQEILDGPVREAASAGTCIYTVGFGDPGDLDEELLRSISSEAACGEYNYASAPDELERVYIRLRHQSLGQILDEFHGEVAQGEQVDAGQVNVPPGQDSLYASLYWPGSVLGLVLTDPQGRVVDESYPGAVVSAYSRMVYAVVDDPLAGTWDVDVFGQDVLAGTTHFDAIVSSRVAVVTPVPTEIPTVMPMVVVPQSAGGIGPALIFLVVAVGAVALLVLAATRGRMRTATAGVTGVAKPRLVVRSGRLAGREFPVGAQEFIIGRGRDADLQLEGGIVSRRHTAVRSARGQFFLQDQGSTHGTYLNGQRVGAATLREGDVIRVGDVELEFRIH
jgi:murein DD-endopeptidase MepM/ murein hydrolase activator NlpD